MPKVYKRVSNRGSWSSESMVLAAKAVQDASMNLYKASVTYGVPRNTLRDRVKGNAAKKPYEKPCVLGSDNEKKLVERIVYLQRLGFGLTISDVRRLAYEFVTKNGMKSHLFSDDKLMAGWDWYRAFMKRNPEITVRQAQSISYARAECMNRPMVYAFFDMFQREVDLLNLRMKPQSIYNADETGLQLHLKPGKILAAKGDRSVLQITNSERGENVTVMGCCNAAGNFIPPMVIFKGQRSKPEFEDGMPPGTAVKMSESGYISSELFLFWLQHFNSHRTQGKVVLLLDGHASHVKSLAVLEYACQNDITMICLPPHTTHFIQPLDRSFFKPLKVYYDQACKTFVSNHPGRSITKLQFGGILNQAWGKAATTANATNGFRICGIYPVDRDAIPDHAYAPSAASDIGPAGDDGQQSVQPSINEQEQEAAPATTSTPVAQRPPLVASTSQAGNTPQHNDEASTVLSPASEISSISFRDLHPTPKIKRARKTSDGRRQKAAVLTSVSYRQQLFAKADAKGKDDGDSCSSRASGGKAKNKGKGKKTQGRSKCKKTKKNKEIKKNKKQTIAHQDKDNPSNFCAECGCSYFDENQNVDEEWICCQNCQLWYHETCADAVNDLYFTCKQCQPNTVTV